ncbi:MAG TPA: hypothetical protein PLK30_21215 [Blastocatellia bacterium]|nr:hypothetical protein [Blastocatellia bacterium]
MKAEINVLESSLAELERENLRSSLFMQKLGRILAFGAAGKLEWARFKLNFKREQLDEFRNPGASGVMVAGQLRTLGDARETMRQKMERMIAENPAELEPHIRRVYQPQIDAGR